MQQMQLRDGASGEEVKVLFGVLGFRVQGF
jgi:hypothetical protein